MKTIVCSLLLLGAVCSRAVNVEDWLQTGLLHPDLIASVRDELDLTADQEGRLNSLISEARKESEPLEQAVKEEQKALNRLLLDTSTTPDAAGAQLAKLLAAEAAVKQLQLRALIGVRDVLTLEQLKKARKLGPPKMASSREDLEARVLEKTGRLRAALESLGIPPTEAMKERGDEIEQIIKSGQFADADAKLELLMEDARLKELEAEPDQVDFSRFEPGSTDLESLRQRYEDVKGAGQSIISLPLMRELLQAKAAFEEAKAAQDAEQVGRILTYVEGKLKQD